MNDFIRSYPTCYPICPRGDFHETAPFWRSADPVNSPPRGIMCLWCDQPLLVFDDETEREATRLHVVLERVGPPVLGAEFTTTPPTAHKGKKA